MAPSSWLSSDACVAAWVMCVSKPSKVTPMTRAPRFEVHEAGGQHEVRAMPGAGRAAG